MTTALSKVYMTQIEICCPFFYFGPAYRYATGCNGALTDMHPIILIRNCTCASINGDNQASSEMLPIIPDQH